MDKRTILYIFLVSVSFFGANIYFSKQRAAEEKKRYEARTAKASAEQEKIAAELTTKTAKVSDLPLVQLDDAHQGFLLNNAVLALAWDTQLPSDFTVNGTSFHLQTKHFVKQSPVIYASSSFQGLELPYLNDQEEIQLVWFENKSPTVSLALYQNEALTLIGPSPKSDAVALIKQKNRWLAAGVYDFQSRVFITLQNLPSLAPDLRLTQSTFSPDLAQQLYVLENNTVQLVFSSTGGALCEINLPLHSKEDEVSVVNAIGFDRDIAEHSPLNARFPLMPYHQAGSSQLVESKAIGGYYPLIRRTLETTTNTKPLDPQYYALNIVSDFPEIAKLTYTVESFTKDTIVFVSTQAHRKISKTFRLVEGAPYLFDCSIKIDGDARGLWVTSGVPEVEIMSNTSSPSIQYRAIRKGKAEMEKLSLPKSKESISSSTVSPSWMVNSNGYLGIILNPRSEIGSGYRVLSIPGNLAPTRLSLIDPKYHPYPANKYPGYQVLLPLSQKGGTNSFYVYAGPFEEKTLKAVDQFISKQDGENPHYLAARSFHGWLAFIARPFAKLLFVVMQFFHAITHSWAISIILLTVFLRVLLYPLNTWSIKSMRRMQELTPKVQAIQSKYKKDQKRAQMEIMMLYKEQKVNPLMGCVPILIQLPFLIAMFDLLKSSFQLRGASFIPGWIDNLTAPDVLFCWQRPIFFFGNCFHLLPFLLGAVMFLQQRVMSGQKVKVDQMTDQQRQQRAMGSIMTVVFTFMFYNFPSGLNIYWLSSMSLGILQQWITNKVLDKNKGKPEVIVPEKKTSTKK